MGEEFNPDQFLAETAPSKQIQPGTDFNPDKFLAETANPAQPVSFGPTMPRSSKEQSKLGDNEEATLGVWNRAKLALEPNQSNKEALLRQQFGDENVFKANDGELFINQDGELRPINTNGLSVADFADFAGALPETVPQVIGTGLGVAGGAAEAVAAPATGGTSLAAIAPTVAGGRFVGGVVGSGFRQALSAAAGTPQVAGIGERLVTAGTSGIANAAGGYLVDKASPYMGKIGAALNEKVFKPAGQMVTDTAGAIGDTIKATVPGASRTAELVGTTYNATKNAIEGLSKSFSLKEAPNAKELISIAEKHGIDPDVLPAAVKYGKASIVSRAERSHAEGPYGEKLMNNFIETHGKVSDALQNVIDSLAPDRPKTAIEAGQFLKDSIDNVGKNLVDSQSVTYKSAVDNYPGLKLSKDSQEGINSALNELKKYAKEKVRIGVGQQVPEAKTVLKMIDAFKRTDGTLKQTVDFMENLGKEAFRPGAPGQVPLDKGIARDFYFVFRDHVTKTVEDAYGKDAAVELTKNNELVSQYLKDKKVFGRILDNPNANPEDLFKSIMTNGGSKRIETLKAMIPEEQLTPLKASFLESLVKKNQDGLVSFKQTVNELERRKDVVSTLFKPEEIKDFIDVLKLGKGMGDATLSSSGTGASHAFQDAVKDVKGAIASESNLELLKQKAAKANMPTPQIAKPAYLNRNSFGAPVAGGRIGKALYQVEKPPVDFNQFYGDQEKKNDGRKPGNAKKDRFL